MTDHDGATPARDGRLAAALRELPVPFHRDTFWFELDERLLDDRRARRAAQQGMHGTAEPPATSVAGDDHPPPEGPIQIGRPSGHAGGSPPPRPPGPVTVIRSRGYTQDPGSIVLQLARHAGDLQPHRPTRGFRRPRHRLRVGLAIVLSAVLVLVAVGVLVGRDSGGSDRPAGVAGAVEEIASAMAAPASLSGGLSVTEFPLKTGLTEPVTRVFTFVWRIDGSYRITAADGTSDEGYDAAAGVRRSIQHAPGFGSVVNEASNLPPGPPDGPSPEFRLSAAVTAVFRAVRSDPANARTVEESRDGRDAIVVETPIVKESETGPDRARLFVDPDSELPFAVTLLVGDEPYEDIRIDNLAVDAPLGAENFAVPTPGGADVTSADHGFRRVSSPAEATATAGYAAAVPSYLPDGFKLAEVAVAGQAQSPGPANPDGTPGAAQAAEGVIVLSYRRGLEQLVVTARRGVTPTSGAWTDPFGVAPEGAVTPFDLDAGRFDGVTVESVRAPTVVSHVWGRTDELVFAVSGLLPADELVRVAESLG
ncbi:MAG: hypothetical protein ACRD29_05305 [Acidimicrobiales bacterium]